MATSSTEISSLLRERILSGEIPPGERLQQIPLSEMLGISRTPLREALATLTNEGLLLYEPNRGYTVRSFSLDDVLAAFDVRARLEALACGIAAKRGMSPAALRTLAECVERGDRILSKGILDPSDLGPYRQMNVEFHDTIIQAADNRYVMDFVRQCHNVPLASDRIFVWEDYEIIRRSHDDHRRIAEALSERDGERAEYLMREHVYFAGIVLQRSLDTGLQQKRTKFNLTGMSRSI
ncbi:GntR family transcriptional regulator [Microvirga rosea]|uniref:GntR family transcriptional regulator n=1 Tax=Microvirga rosea TaxID=2715425 RepID=UPI001D0A5CE2|nr:GntR family transcriptional regulator [Microvirga rosea]MCB8821099.1 GntR family transcriptional regulator [Microvirga rosea]